MTETKRFWILNTLTEYSGIKDKDKLLTFNEVVDLLNELSDENEQLKQELIEFKKWETYVGDVKREDLDKDSTVKKILTVQNEHMR